RLVLRQQVPRPPHLQPGGVRHVHLQRRAQDPAAAELRPGHQPGQRQVGGGAGQRPRPVPRRPGDRPQLRRRGEAGHRRPRYRPRPSLAGVAPLDNGQAVVVRVNARGPSHDGRVIDLSYAAAVKLGIAARGTGRVEVRALVPGEDDGTRYAARPAAVPAPAQVAAAPAQTAPATPATALDQLVQALPEEAPPVANDPPAVASAPAAAPVAASVHAAPSVISPSAQLLQVASFSSADNARRALERLLAAGISEARIEDATSGGRTLWRLRVPAAGDPAELALRIAGLGFGTPQPVRD